MQIRAGTRLGPYEIVSPAGAGGMGEVYRARDTRLERQVAIKVLPAELSTNAQLRLRFEQEARTISALNHPHICTLHDVGHENGVDFLVMEFCEGETLAQRLTRGPLPIEQALRCGIEITEALDKAHRQGIIHRDLKPGNIMLTKSGAKLLDFGLAKYRQPLEQPIIGLSALATDHHPLTAEGTILGTFQYMAPEQLEGREADARTDIFALGAVLYETATGKRAFEGKSKASLIASILDRDPAPISTIQPMTPPALERVVKTCLAKDPDDRWQTAHDVMLELKWIAEGSAAGLAAPVITRRRERERLSWATTLAAVAATAIFATLWYRATHQRPPVVYSSILPPAATQFAFESGPMALSPDGRKIAFVAKAADGKDLLHVRSLNASNAQPLAGTEGASFPFWSPDSRFLGFFAGGKLKKVDGSGGPTQTLSEASVGRGGSWNRDGMIVFAPSARSGIHKVSAAGGASTAITELESARSEFTHRWPVFLPDGRHFLYLAQRAFGSAEENVISAGSLDLNQRVELVRANSPAAFSPGYLIFWRDRTLLAQPFDSEVLKMTGDPFPIAEEVQYVANTASAIFSVSQQGTLAYQVGTGLGQSQLAWFDRTGKQIEAVEPAEDYRGPQISRDGRKIVVEKIAAGAKSDLWMYDVVRKVWTRFTFDPGNEFAPLWSPDGNRVVFSSNRKGNVGDLFWKISTGSGSDESLLESKAWKIPNDWSEDGRLILFQNQDPPGKNGWDLWVYSIPERKASPVLQTEFNELLARFSPDQKWIVYASNESASNQIYVQPFPGPGGKWQISTTGGTHPRWSHDGREIFYVAPDRKLMSVEVRTSPSFEAGIPRALFEVRPQTGPQPFYDVSTDGKRFLVNNSVAPEVSHPITLVQSWTAELER